MSTILRGDCRDTMATLKAGTVHCCVTSPPYYGLREYLPAGHPDAEREIGQEPSFEAYLDSLVKVFQGVKRVLHDSGTLWLNIGDSYARKPSRGGSGTPTGRNGRGEQYGSGEIPVGLKEKDLCMTPFRLALALQADGWYLRSIIVWNKLAPMPDSTTDRPTNEWEPIFLLSKCPQYFFDNEAVKEPSKTFENRAPGIVRDRTMGYDNKLKARKNIEGSFSERGVPRTTEGLNLKTQAEKTKATRNIRNVWELGPEPYSGAHFAPFPSEIPRRAILAGTSAKGCCPICAAPWERNGEGWQSTCACRVCYGCGENKKGEFCDSCDMATQAHRPVPCTVLDPFGGSGTTGMVATELGRGFILCELNEAYLPLIDSRTNVTPGLPLA